MSDEEWQQWTSYRIAIRRDYEKFDLLLHGFFPLLTCASGELDLPR
uniref:Uncharacterized protein n=1 Tax=Nelumbo nucifera TaxID=4432 RepID=A0A822XHG8_NELNU|nr:TPA_asm: hypothetical protein HUJ06_020044 [Nelumbo nucifera]